ncbi:MAG TPA: GIY-YIG nuclease family protein, partial [Actinomycetes bacterium]
MSPSAFTDAEDPRTHHVYRIYAADNDELLYIGCTQNVQTRLYYMTRQCNLGNHVNAGIAQRGLGRVESQEYPDKATAREAERQAIAAEAPLLNRQHNPKRWSKRDAVPVEPVTLDEMRDALQKLG